MNNVIDIAKEINTELKQIPEIQEYLRLKTLYDADEIVQSLLKKMNDPKVTKKEYSGLIDEYFKNPLVNNYLQARAEALDVINTVKDGIK